MEFGVKKITETTIDDEEKGVTVKYAVKATSVGETDTELIIKETGTCSYSMGDRVEVKKIQSQKTLVPVKRGPGRPKKGEVVE